MDYFKSYKENSIVLFDLNLIDAAMEGDSGLFNIQSNIPDEILDKAYPNHYDDLMKINYQNKEAIEQFLNTFCNLIIQQPEASYFYFPKNSIGRTLGVNDFLRKMRSFNLEDIKPKTLYSINENPDEFYFISKGFSYERLYNSEDFIQEAKTITKSEFQKLLPPEFRESYFDFYNDKNIYFLGIEDNQEYLMLTDDSFCPLLFFMNSQDL
jgi:hypothetical protein